MKLYLGVDLHKRNCWVTVMTLEGVSSRVAEFEYGTGELAGVLREGSEAGGGGGGSDLQLVLLSGPDRAPGVGAAPGVPL